MKPRPPVSVKSTRRSCSAPPNAAASLPSLATTSEYSPPFIPPTLQILHCIVYSSISWVSVLFVMSHSSPPSKLCWFFFSLPFFLHVSCHLHWSFSIPSASPDPLLHRRVSFPFLLPGLLLAHPPLTTSLPRPGRPSPLTTLDCRDASATLIT